MHNRRQSFKELRTFTVLDLENQCGGSELVPAYAKEVKRQFKSLALPFPSQTVIAVGSRAYSLYPQLSFDFREARILCRSGINGADICLCEVLINEAAAARSKYVVIGSGDAMFAKPAAFLKAKGTNILVIGRRGSISSQLFKVANQVMYIDDKAFFAGSTNIQSPL